MNPKSHPYTSFRPPIAGQKWPMVSMVLSVIVLGVCAALAQGPDIVIGDFEGTNYGDWKVTGTAFGSGPDHGTLPGQMKVDGFQGKGLVNSFNGGDDSTGTLTSPAFTVERKFIQFLIGGGGWEGKTCMNLLVDGHVVRTATGTNTDPGGSEHLEPAQWDVSEFLGKAARLEIVDEATGGWGHITIDQIVQSDNRISAPVLHFDATREIMVEKTFLNFPIKNGATKRRVTVLVEGKEARGFDIELADGKPDWWAFLDATPFHGQTITIRVNKLSEESTGLSFIDQSEEIKDGQNLYRETLRPQFHFTSRRGWLNDPNGLLYYQGEYHLFYQHNPYGWDWGNMSWGHAVSKDLVHWHELPVALYPDEHGTMFSGSAVVDWNNTAGFQTGTEPPLVAMFTAAGKPFTQCLAYSNDRGRTWVKYKNNPVLDHIAAENRDPKVAWFAPQKKWVMALYLDHNDYAIFESHDLKQWKKLQDLTLPGDAECPNFFEIPLDDAVKSARWVFFGASGIYVVGTFDGNKFTPETQPRHLHNGNCWYAAQVYSDIPPGDGRCLLVPWGRLPDGEIFRGLPFNQMMGLPVELTLKTTEEGPQLLANPVRELASLRVQSHTISPQSLSPGENPLAAENGELLDLAADLSCGEAVAVGFNLRGININYDVKKQELSCLDRKAPLKMVDGKIRLRLLVDRASVDIFGNDGRLYMPMASRLSETNRSWDIYARGGLARINSLEVNELKSAWLEE